MNEIIALVILLLAPMGPILFFFLPSIRRLPVAWFLTILPAFPALLVSQSFSMQIPLLISQITIGFYTFSKWILGCTVLLWLAVLTTTDQNRFKQDHIFSGLFLLAMANSLANVVTHSILGFYLFYSLLGYACYGVLVRICGEQLQRMAKIYLFLQILGDLLLFEFCLTLAKKTGMLNFTSLYAAIADPETQGPTLSLALAGVIAKAGVWPLHFWLPILFRFAPISIMILLGIIIPSVGMFGWFNLFSGVEDLTSVWPHRIQMIGSTGLLYSVLIGLTQKQPGSVLAYALIALVSQLLMVFGNFLDRPVDTGHPTVLLILPIIHYALSGTALVLSLRMAAYIISRPSRLWLWLIPTCLYLTGTMFIALMISGSEGGRITAPELWPVTALTLLVLRFGFLVQTCAKTKSGKPYSTLVILQTGIVLAGLASLIYWINILNIRGLGFPEFRLAAAAMLAGFFIAFSTWKYYKRFNIIKVLRIPPGDIVMPLEYLSNIILQKGLNFGQHTLPALKARFLKLIGFPWEAKNLLAACKNGENNLQSWRTAILLMLSLVLTLAIALEQS